MRYSDKLLSTRSVDWFGNIGGNWIMANSIGGRLPSKVNDIQNLSILHHLVWNLPIMEAEKLVVNEELIGRRYDRDRQIKLIRYGQDNLEEWGLRHSFEVFQQNYVSYFREFAKRGLITYVRENIDEREDQTYTWVVKPQKNVEIPELKRDAVLQKIGKILEQREIASFMKYWDGIHLSGDNLFQSFNG